MQKTFLPLSLLPCGGNSFDTNDLAGLCDWLHSHDFFTVPARNPRIEYARMANSRGALVILYFTGAVVVQGKKQHRTVALLSTVVGLESEVWDA